MSQKCEKALNSIYVQRLSIQNGELHKAGCNLKSDTHARDAKAKRKAITLFHRSQKARKTLYQTCTTRYW